MISQKYFDYYQPMSSKNIQNNMIIKGECRNCRSIMYKNRNLFAKVGASCQFLMKSKIFNKKFCVNIKSFLSLRGAF
jgi:hypothetical protein